MNSFLAGLGSQQQQPAASSGAETFVPDGKMIDLTKTHLDKSDCYARNEAKAFPMTNLFIGDTRLGCKSDADEQLIIHISFNEFVKVHSIKMTEYNLGLNPEWNPTLVKLYVNRENVGFEDADDIDPTQEIVLTAEDLKEDAAPVLLKFVKFQRVRSITVFVAENAGGDVTAIGGLKLFGQPLPTTNMSEFKKTE